MSLNFFRETYTSRKPMHPILCSGPFISSKQPYTHIDYTWIRNTAPKYSCTTSTTEVTNYPL